MPVTITRTPVEVEKRDTGIGGKPPVDRRPTGGGGDGDNWENRPPGRRGPRELLIRYRMVVLFALAGDLMFFIALVSVFFARQTAGHLDARSHAFIGDWHPILVPPILWLNTAVLLLSSFTMEMARRQLFREIDVMEEWLGLGRPAVRRATPWLLATLVLGCLFVVGQLMAWQQLVLEGYQFSSSPASYFFYLITGTHGVHLVVGIAALAAALAALFLLRRVAYRQIVVDCTAWYWHSMGLFWLFLLGLLAFGQ
jgi:cytochrome c oxidase subunit 3